MKIYTLIILLFATSVKLLRAETIETISVDFPGATAGQVIRAMADIYKLDVVFTDELAEKKVNLKLIDVHWRTVLRLTVTPLGYSFYERDNVVYFTDDLELVRSLAYSELLKLRKENIDFKERIWKLEAQLPMGKDKPNNEQAPQEPTAEALETISIDYPDVTVMKVVRAVGDIYKLNVVITDELAEKKVSLKLQDVDWRTIFKLAVTPLGYTFYEEDNVVYFTDDFEFIKLMANSELLNLRKENKELKDRIRKLEAQLPIQNKEDEDHAPIQEPAKKDEK